MPPRVEVHAVVLQNFKSYEGLVKVGPFRKFTCVVGPNGAGKSNLMEAIGFVLGLRTRLRGDRLEDLVHRKEGEAEAFIKQKPCSVELHLVEGGIATVFRRTLQPLSEAGMQINGVAVAQDEYARRLESINIISQARNFLVFQGDVDAAAKKQGKELTQLLEQVSGSIVFKEEYDRLALEMEQKEHEARNCFSRRHDASKEKRFASKQKEEAETYRKLEASKKALHAEHYLFRLHCASSQAQTLQSEVAAADNDRLQAEVALARSHSRLEAADSERAKASLASNTAERALAGSRERLARVSCELSQVRSKLEVLQSKLQELKINGDRDVRRSQQLQMQASLLRDRQLQLEAELPALQQKAQRQLHFTAAQRTEFDRLKTLADTSLGESGQQARELQSQIRLLAAERSRAEQDSREATSRRDHLRNRAEDLVLAEQQAAVLFERYGAAAEKRLAEFQALKASCVDHQEERRLLTEKRQALLKQMQDVTATERQIEHDKKTARVASELTQLLQGVRGRVADLCQPAQRRLHVAVNVALAGYLDAMITDHAPAARQCVSFLKERMLEPMTFLPMENLRASLPDHRLQEAVRGHHGLRHAMSCVTFEARFARAFEFLLGDVIIADTLEEGRRFMFGECRSSGIGCRIVTLDGETISKDGNMSVNAEAARRGSTRFDFASLEASKVKLEMADRRLHELQALDASSDGNRTSLQDEALELERLRRSAQLALERTREELLRLRRKDLEAAEKSAETLAPEAARLLQEESALLAKQKELEAKTSAATKGLFEALSKELGVDDVRKLEEEHRRAREAAKLRENDLLLRLGNVKAELQMVEKSLEERSGRDASGQHVAVEAETFALQEQLRALTAEQEGSAAELERMSAMLQERKDTERGLEQAVAAQRGESREQTLKLAEVSRSLAGLTAQLHSSRELITTILRSSRLEDVDIPLTKKATRALSLAAKEAFSDDVASEPAFQLEAIDMRRLPEEKRAITGGPAAQLLEEEYRSELFRLSAELEQLTPNFKAVLALQDAAGKAADASIDAFGAKGALEDVQARFEAVKKARKDRFLVCFQQVKAAIGPVYRKLTAGVRQDGGTADLDLEDLDDPYLAGIKFIAMPPLKRFSDISLLSGGEKSLAAMALLFAIQQFQKPPFLVLDEVDAYLDAANVQALARYVEQSDCQTIVISQKDQFFCKSEGLLGISKDKRREASVVLTMDLTRLRERGLMMPLPPPALLAGAGG